MDVRGDDDVTDISIEQIEAKDEKCIFYEHYGECEATSCNSTTHETDTTNICIPLTKIENYKSDENVRRQIAANEYENKKKNNHTVHWSFAHSSSTK